MIDHSGNHTGTASAVVCLTDAECVEKTITQAMQNTVSFLWTQLRDLTRFQERRAIGRRQASQASQVNGTVCSMTDNGGIFTCAVPLMQHCWV